MVENPDHDLHGSSYDIPHLRQRELQPWQAGLISWQQRLKLVGNLPQLPDCLGWTIAVQTSSLELELEQGAFKGARMQL
jgi:hypothetical protein